MEVFFLLFFLCSVCVGNVVGLKICGGPYILETSPHRPYNRVHMGANQKPKTHHSDTFVKCPTDPTSHGVSSLSLHTYIFLLTHLFFLYFFISFSCPRFFSFFCFSYFLICLWTFFFSLLFFPHSPPHCVPPSTSTVRHSAIFGMCL